MHAPSDRTATHQYGRLSWGCWSNICGRTEGCPPWRIPLYFVLHPMQQQQPHRQNNSSWTGVEGGLGNMWKRMRWWWWVTNALMQSSLTQRTTKPTFSNHHRPNLHQNHCHDFYQHFHRITLQHRPTHRVKYTFDIIEGDIWKWNTFTQPLALKKYICFLFSINSHKEMGIALSDNSASVMWAW